MTSFSLEIPTEKSHLKKTFHSAGFPTREKTEDLAPKEKVVELEKKLQTAEQQISTLSHENVNLKNANKELSIENTKLKENLRKVKEDLEKCQERILQEPTIPPESRKSPFEI